MRDVWRIVDDPEDVEYVRSPEFQLWESTKRYNESGDYCLCGDCDDAATFAAAILAAMDCPCSLIAIRQAANDPEFSHVWARAYVGDGVIDVDPIVPESEMPVDFVEQMEISVLR